MKIKVIQTDLYHVPLDPPLSDSTHGEMPFFELIAVRVRDEDGLEGLGYTYTVGRGGGAVCRMIEDDLKPLLIGRDACRIEHLWERMWWGLHYVGRGGAAAMAISPVDIALWDLKGKRFIEPLWKLLGGHNPKVPIYGGGVDLQFPLEKLEAQTAKFLDRGFGAVKMKVGRPSLSEDVERVKAVRSLVGPAVDLMVDANNGFRVDRALKASRAFAEFDVFWLEEPTIPDDLPGHVKIASEGPTPVAAGESLRTVYEFRQYIAGGALAFPQPDASNLGGITPWMKVAHLAEAFNLPVSSHGIHDIHAHTLAAVPNGSYLEEHGFGLEKYMTRPLTIEDGYAVAPERPGHGVELDRHSMESLRQNV